MSQHPAVTFRSAWVGAAAVLALAPGTLSPAAADVAPRNRPGDAVQTALNELVGGGEFPGALAAVRERDGRGRNYTAGAGDLATRAKVPVNGQVRIASTTKTFTAAVVLQLAGEGKVELDVPVEKYLPRLVRGNGNDGRLITVRQLLHHTSGLPEHGKAIAGTFFENQHRYFEPRDLVDLALTQKPLFAPGKGWSYSNTGYVLLGLLVQKVTGRPIGAEITDRIITPLGLGDTYWPGAGEQRIRGPHPRAYKSKTGRPGGEPVDVSEMDPSRGWAAGQLVSTPRDVNRFLSALLGGKLLKPAMLEQMKRAVSVPGTPRGWGYGLGLTKIPLSCGGLAWGHSGDVGGYSTRNGITEGGRSATVTATAESLTAEGDKQLNSALDTALCAGK
ncbi:serine hydrolase domain-containing protein [Microtetraspora malaysiensis]|uniref:serine hydrolase domain-containing protein n=1 Tax=Microtetraspora malaysiensis TaxID=161358 RepID=UPI000831B46B|nr:serine hydrolase domain-containing protein [Microtetraspora malaysiensis]